MRSQLKGYYGYKVDDIQQGRYGDPYQRSTRLRSKEF